MNGWRMPWWIGSKAKRMAAKEKLYVVGFGLGDDGLLTGQAKAAIASAQRVISTGRIGSGIARAHGLGLTELIAALRQPAPGGTAVLVSGDCGFYSLAKIIVRDFSELYQIHLIPGISSIQYLSAAIQIPYDHAALVSLHGKSGNIVAIMSYQKQAFVLSGGANSARRICAELSCSGLGSLRVIVGERLSYPDEQLTSGTAEQLADQDFDELAVLYIANPAAHDPSRPLVDADFMRSEVPMTKQEVRWLSVARLGVAADDTVFDIGAGSGSVSIELARKACSGRVLAIEKNPAALALIRQNVLKLGAFNVELVAGEAPAAFAGLPAPNKAFIGGSAHNMDSILGSLIAMNPEVGIVANAVTLQSLHQIIAGFEKHRLLDVETVCVNIARSKRVGAYDMMLAQNPVYIVSGRADGRLADQGAGSAVGQEAKDG
ncbi:MAG: precorrin-6y C5,15-methyltransferase (decarboxylating) subunit CbiE [Actinomycetia bacterium]|nr:precorrin-6y C5,15-methyltransferase (decarboxylating) subunit CbiE [Actinomycetes bacterium]